MKALVLTQSGSVSPKLVKSGGIRKCRSDRKVSRLEILQHVIEYIQDLESQMEFHPDAENLCSGSTTPDIAAGKVHLPMNFSVAGVWKLGDL
ncbi:hypothetical protein BV898_07289 [Hypsibius exemplaris]|uniref:BHLH domain-containing protein n=1 Tax=Hypsibius exemplaris TaxID=2072580 RepID=A0A1W0WTZ5_HYPEX|nr:hypothetical protein BV898_07289 [Hypsibius exemplaris]